jgi:Undecaprenyl-phosphate galactose phosphotransferase WbaP
MDDMDSNVVFPTVPRIGGVSVSEQLSTRLPPYTQRLSRRFVVLSTFIMCDLVVAAVSVAAGNLISEWVFPGTPTATASIPAPIIVVFCFFLGLYQEWGLSLIERLRLRSIAVLLFAAVNLLMLIFSFSVVSAISIVCMSAMLLVLGHYAEIFIRSLLIRSHLWGVPTALIGREACRELASALLAHPELGLRPIGFIEDKAEASPLSQQYPLPVIGRINDSERLAQEVEIVVAVVGNEQEQNRSTDYLARLPFAHVVLVQLGVIPAIGGAIPVHLSGGAMGLYLRRGIYKRGNLLAKRVFDILISLPLLILATPVILASLLAIKTIDRGPGLFRQLRIGKDGRVISVLKLRTMYIDADRRLQEHLARDPRARAEWERYFKLSNDPRVLPIIGNFLRRSSLDELPQLANVLLGHMSLVGPRPFPSYHLNAFDDDFRTLRASVPPGLTGFWQVSARSDGDLGVQKLQDSFYVHNWSFWLDLWILLQTLPAVLFARGAR